MLREFAQRIVITSYSIHYTKLYEAEALADSRDLLEERIDQATAALAAEKDAAERANAAKSRFLAAASHDLRQPLHALSLFTTDLLRQAAAGKLREVPRIAEQIAASTQTLGDMLNALLDISRLDIDGVRVITSYSIHYTKLYEGAYQGMP